MMIELSETALFRQGILAQEPFGNTTGWFGAMCRAVHFKNLGLHRTRTNKTEKNIEPSRTERCVDPWFRRLLSYENALSSAVIKKNYLAKRKLKWNVNAQGMDFYSPPKFKPRNAWVVLQIWFAVKIEKRRMWCKLYCRCYMKLMV